MTTLRISSTLPPCVYALIEMTLGCCLAVHGELGPGLLEGIYSRAVAAELLAQGIPHRREHRVPIRYRGQFLCNQRIDLFVDGKLVVEIKAVDLLAPIHLAQ